MSGKNSEKISGLGTRVAFALSSVGVTPERVEEWLGTPCNCRERQEKLDQLSRWACRVARGKVEGALDFLKAILGED